MVTSLENVNMVKFVRLELSSNIEIKKTKKHSPISECFFVLS
jgi:hypothetical protein